MSNNERFRNDFASKLNLPPDQLKEVLQAFDLTLSDYEIAHKTYEITPANGVPDMVKYFIASKAVENCSSKTLAQYQYKLGCFFKTVCKPFSEIQTNDIRVYLYNFKKYRNASDRYIENIRSTINGFFSWCVINDYINHNPAAKIEHIRYQEKQRQPLTAFELESFRWNTQNIREKALVDFLFSTGCRVSECAGLALSDIDFEKRSVHIRHGKGDKARFVYFNAESELTLRKYIESRTDSTDSLFVSQRKPHNPLSARVIELILKKISKRSGLNVFPHRLRHTFATSGLRGGMPIEKLQRLMGHANPRTTLIYAKIDQEELQRDHQRIYA